MLVDRIEWVIMPDPATAAAAAAERRGRLVGDPARRPRAGARSRSTKDISVDIGDPLGNIGAFRMNHLYPALQQR